MHQRATVVSSAWFVSLWCVVAAFGTYFCMYAFRKPFTAASYEGNTVAGISFKVVLVTAQVFGYMLSKFLGIKIIAEVTPTKRVRLLLTLIGIAEVALLLFAITPAPYNAFWLFVNGVPLGMVFGLVLGFLEGRRQTEALAAGLCTSFIVADGVTRYVGAALLHADISEMWMPVLAGAVFVPPLFVFTWMLARVPAPTQADVAARSERTPMNAAERRDFFKRYALGLTLIVLVYLLITILRSVRADFAKEIWDGMGVTDRPAFFAYSEIAVAIGVLLTNGMIVFIRDHRQAFFTALALALVGAVLVPVALIGYAQGMSPFWLMTLHGLGLYLPYIAVHTTIFERLIAMTKDRGNIGYLMYLADAFGYLGYVLVLVLRNAFHGAEAFFPFFQTLSYVIAGVSVFLLIPCWWSFARHPATQRSASQPEAVTP